MKKIVKSSTLGVTLLEIMLVLAVAAMIIVMSIRYYQSATSSQQANAVLQMIQNITASADGMAQGSGSYMQGGVDTASIQALMPNNSLTTPWGSTITINADTDNNYSVSIAAMPAQVCNQIKPRLASNPKYVGVSTIYCGTTGPVSFQYVYDSQQ